MHPNDAVILDGIKFMSKPSGGVNLSWCDKLASTPTVGFRLEPEFKPAAFVLDAVSPILNAEARGGTPAFTLEKQEAFEVTFTVEDGFTYALSAEKTVVRFAHRIEVKHQSAAVPTARLLTEVTPYTRLLPKVADRLVKVTSLMPNAERRKLLRIGVVSTTIVTEEEMPPGIQDLVERAKEIWGNVLSYTFRTGCIIADHETYTDRCIHAVIKNDGDDSVPVVEFDWQRHYKKPRLAQKKVLEEAAAEGQAAALAYFEQLGEGVEAHV